MPLKNVPPKQGERTNGEQKSPTDLNVYWKYWEPGELLQRQEQGAALVPNPSFCSQKVKFGRRACYRELNNEWIVLFVLLNTWGILHRPWTRSKLMFYNRDWELGITLVLHLGFELCGWWFGKSRGRDFTTQMSTRRDTNHRVEGGSKPLRGSPNFASEGKAHMPPPKSNPCMIFLNSKVNFNTLWDSFHSVRIIVWNWSRNPSTELCLATPLPNESSTRTSLWKYDSDCSKMSEKWSCARNPPQSPCRMPFPS